MKCFLCVLVISFYFTATNSLRGIYPQYTSDPPPPPSVVGDPVFVTKYIEEGDITQGQLAALVKPVKANVKSYAGFFTVNKQYNSNLYFWYFPAEKNPETAPVVLWLQGGPGASSLYGLFAENGPFYVKMHRGLKMRKYYWSQALNVIYIDNPVGTGYSFTDNDAGYAKDEVAVGKDLYEALIQFFKLFPNLQKNDFYVAGESYAGKYVPAVAYTIHNNNKQSSQKINLQGISIGNGLCDPENMMNYGDYLYQISLIDANGRLMFQQKQRDIIKNIQAKNFIKAFQGFDSLLNGDLTPYKSLFYNLTGFSFYFNLLHNTDDSPYGDVGEYVQKDVMRRSMHVGNLTFHSDSKVETNLQNDIMQSIKPWMEILVENYRVLIYNGQLDIIVPYPLTVNFLKSMKWSGASLYKVAPRKQWWVGSELAGYSKTVNKLTEVLVRNAGHMVPGDQPKWALDLIVRFTSNKPF